jgi:hypothetical protein
MSGCVYVMYYRVMYHHYILNNFSFGIYSCIRYSERFLKGFHRWWRMMKHDHKRDVKDLSLHPTTSRIEIIPV